MSYLVNDVFPAGIVLPYAGSTAPAGWLLCNTATPILIASYPRLHSAIGNTYNGGVTPGDGVTTFNLPNLSGVFPRGAGSKTISGITYSGTLGSNQTDQLQGHRHSSIDSFTQGTGSVPYAYSVANIGTYAVRPDSLGGVVNNVIGDGTNGTPRTGSETHPANIGVNYIIKI